MVYAVNTRGRAVSLDEKDLQKYLSSGFVQITKDQFESATYYPQYDRGSAHIHTPVPTQEIPIKTSEKAYFETVVV